VDVSVALRRRIRVRDNISAGENGSAGAARPCDHWLQGERLHAFGMVKASRIAVCVLACAAAVTAAADARAANSPNPKHLWKQFPLSHPGRSKGHLQPRPSHTRTAPQHPAAEPRPRSGRTRGQSVGDRGAWDGLYVTATAVAGALLILLALMVTKRRARRTRPAAPRAPALPGRPSTDYDVIERIAPYTSGAESPAAVRADAVRANTEAARVQAAEETLRSEIAAAVTTKEEAPQPRPEPKPKPAPEPVAEQAPVTGGAASVPSRRAVQAAPGGARRSIESLWRRLGWLLSDALPAAGDRAYYIAALVLAVGVGLGIAYLLGGP
jgi:hypothetical protein